MAARETANPVAVEFFVQLAFANVLVDDVAKGRHGRPLSSYSKPQYRDWNALRLRTGRRAVELCHRAKLLRCCVLPAVLNGTLYVGSGDGNLYRFSLGDALPGRSTLANRPKLQTLHPDLHLQPSD